MGHAVVRQGAVEMGLHRELVMDAIARLERVHDRLVLDEGLRREAAAALAVMMILRISGFMIE